MGKHWTSRPLKSWAGIALTAIGAVSLVVAMVTPAAAAPSVTVTPHNNLTNGQTVSVSGSGFSPPAQLPFAIVLECNDDPGQPTVIVQNGSPAVPVGCTNPFNNLFNFASGGTLPATPVVVHSGTIGPPATGTDSANHPAATDAALYPCPPTPAQVAAGDTCQIVLTDVGGNRATQNITFAGSGPTTTTSTASSSTTTTAKATTTTTASSGATTTSTAAPTTSTTQPATTTTSESSVTTTSPSSSTSTTTPPASTTTTTSSGASLTVSPSTVSPGDTVTVNGSAFPANSVLTVSFASTPVTLGTVTSNGQGAFVTMVTIPSDAAVGTHHITISGTGGNTLASVSVTVVAPGTATTTTTAPPQVLGTSTTSGLAFTGLDSRTLVIIGVGCLLVGLVTVADSRRTRRT